jgi:glycosyltransferase involved in cell wall biosynthesis
MKKNTKNLLATILVVNFNNKKYLSKCLISIFKQKYKKIEIIVIDDQSTDHSIDLLNKFKNKIKIIKTKKKIGKGSFNQINAYYEGFKKSRGDIIFLLDSDDYFKSTKIFEIIKLYNLDKKRKIIFDLPIKKFSKKEVKIDNKKFLNNNYWPYIPPTSCISIKRIYFKRLFRLVNFRNFPDIWLDFRIGIVAKYILKDLFILNKHLTYYRQSNTNISSNFKHMSFNWWKRRKEAHSYIKYFFSRNNIHYSRNIDYFITNLINIFIK